MTTPHEAKARAATTYNAAADSYDHPANTFWDRFGQGTVERLRLEPGERVLDVCCGCGACRGQEDLIRLGGTPSCGCF